MNHCAHHHKPLPMLTTIYQFEAISGSLSCTNVPPTAASHISLYRSSLEYNNSFRKTLPWQLLSPDILPDSAKADYTIIITYKCFVAKISCWNTSVRRQPYKNFSTLNFSCKISYNKNFPIYGSNQNVYKNWADKTIMRHFLCKKCLGRNLTTHKKYTGTRKRYTNYSSCYQLWAWVLYVRLHPAVLCHLQSHLRTTVGQMA